MAAKQHIKAAKAAQEAKLTAGQIEEARLRIAQVQSLAILAASDNACDEETHRDVAVVIADCLGRILADLGAER